MLTMVMAAAATGLRNIEVHPNRKAARGPKAWLRKTVVPPERGVRTASSAITSAPHIAAAAPTTHASNESEIEPVLPATTPGDCRMPTPIVKVTSTSAAFHTPRWRGSRLGSVFGAGAAGSAGDMRRHCGRPRPAQAASAE